MPNITPESEKISDLAPGSIPDHDFNSPSHQEYFFGVPHRHMSFIKYIFAVLFLILVVCFGTWLYFSNQQFPVISPLGSNPNENGKKNSGPLKDVMNPLTGVMYTREESAPWTDIRPLGVMVNNHPDARPQVGLDKADIVYEIVAEGGITRFLPFFLTNTPEKVGPIRSTREYYLVLVKEMGDAILMHIGWSPQALEAIESWPVRSLGRGGGTFYRENPRNVATEHTAYSDGRELRTRSIELGWSGTRPIDPWKFKDTQDLYENEPLASEVTIDFWYAGDFTAHFKYVPGSNTYQRYMGYDEADQFVPHVDDLTKKQLEFKNIVVQFAEEASIPGDDKNRLTYELTGSGSALIFIDGKVIKSTWSKTDRDSRTKFFDLNGKEIEFNRGSFWISIVPDRNQNQVGYK